MKTLYQLVEDKPTIKEQALEIKRQREEIKHHLNIMDVNFTEENITDMRILLSEDFGFEETKRAYYLVS